MVKFCTGVLSQEAAVTVFCHIIVICSGSLGYGEWKKFRKRLKILPDVFDMEKQLHQYIFLPDLQGYNVISFLFGRLPCNNQTF